MRYSGAESVSRAYKGSINSEETGRAEKRGLTFVLVCSDIFEDEGLIDNLK
jgi:hypothetical protein